MNSIKKTKSVIEYTYVTYVEHDSYMYVILKNLLLKNQLILNNLIPVYFEGLRYY